MFCKCPMPSLILQPRPGNNLRPTGSVYTYWKYRTWMAELTLAQASDGSGSLAKLQPVHTHVHLRFRSYWGCRILENKNGRPYLHIVQKSPWILTYEEESKTKAPNSWLGIYAFADEVTTRVESVHTQVQEPPNWRRARNRQCTLSFYVCIVVYLTYFL